MRRETSDEVPAMRRDLTVKVRLAGSELVRLDELRPAGGRIRKQI